MTLTERLDELFPTPGPLTPEQVNAVYAELSAETITEALEHRVGELGIIKAFANPIEGNAVIAALEAFAASDDDLAPLVARVIRHLAPGADGVDVGNEATRTMLLALAAKSVLTSAQAATISAIADVQRPKWPNISRHQISRARSLA